MCLYCFTIKNEHIKRYNFQKKTMFWRVLPLKIVVQKSVFCDVSVFYALYLLENYRWQLTPLFVSSEGAGRERRALWHRGHGRLGHPSPDSCDRPGRVPEPELGLYLPDSYLLTKTKIFFRAHCKANTAVLSIILLFSISP